MTTPTRTMVLPPVSQRQSGESSSQFLDGGVGRGAAGSTAGAVSASAGATNGSIGSGPGDGGATGGLSAPPGASRTGFRLGTPRSRQTTRAYSSPRPVPRP